MDKQPVLLLSDIDEEGPSRDLNSPAGKDEEPVPDEKEPSVVKPARRTVGRQRVPRPSCDLDSLAGKDEESAPLSAEVDEKGSSVLKPACRTVSRRCVSRPSTRRYGFRSEERRVGKECRL